MRRLPPLPTAAALALALLMALLFGVLRGEADYAPGRIVAALTAGPAGSDEAVAVVWGLRLPRVLLAAGVGAALAVAGAALQGLTGNPLADPFLVGVASGASVGAGIALLLGLSPALLPVLALAGALAATALVFALSRQDGETRLAGFLLAGVVVGTFLASLMHLLLALAGQAQSRVLGWLLGYLDEATWLQVGLLAVCVAGGTAGLSAAGRGLDAFSFGEETARAVGVPVERFKALTLLAVALLTAAAVSVSGVIGFVGLVVPHLVRALVGPPHRPLLPLCALAGATLLVLADLLARTLRPGQPLPVGVVTALVGAPCFVLLLRRHGA